MYLTNICTSYRIRVKFADKLTLRQISHFIFMKTDKDMFEEVTPTEIEARTSIGGCQLIRKTTPQTMRERERERGLFKSDMVLIHVAKAKFHFLQILILGEVFCTFCGW